MPQWMTDFLDSDLPKLLDALLNVRTALIVILVAVMSIWRKLSGNCRADAINGWCSDLGHVDEAIRQEAMKKLIGCGYRSVDHLVEVLYQTDSDNSRKMVVEILCEIGYVALRPLLGSRKDDIVARFVDEALGARLPRVVERWGRKQENAPIWQKLQRHILRMPNEDIVSCLIILLDDADPFVQQGAVLALGCYPRPGIVRILGQRLYPTECKNSDIRRAAAESLGQLHLPEAVDYLKIALCDINRDVQITACRALGNIGEEGAIWALQDVLLPYEEAEVRIEAVNAIAAIGGRKAVDILTRTQSQQSDTNEVDQTLQDAVATKLALLQRKLNREEQI